MEERVMRAGFANEEMKTRYTTVMFQKVLDNSTTSTPMYLWRNKEEDCNAKAPNSPKERSSKAINMQHASEMTLKYWHMARIDLW